MVPPDDTAAPVMSGPRAADTLPQPELETFGLLGPVLVGIIVLWIVIAAMAGQSI
jgi:hypothetical protein